MSLTTLLEAAKYLDYLDSSQQQQQQSSSSSNNNNNTQQQQQDQQQQLIYHNEQSQTTTQGQPIIGTSYRAIKKSPGSSGRARARRATISSRRNANGSNNDMIAMSLPASATLAASIHQNNHQHQNHQSHHNQHHNHHHHHHLMASGSGGINATSFMMMSKSPPPSATLLSSSYTPGSPQSSPTSIALLSSKTSGVTSNISSAASSLSSSDTSSSCGEILMSELDFNQCATSVGSNSSISKTSRTAPNHHDYHKQHQSHTKSSSSHTSKNNNNNNNVELSNNIQQQNNNNQLTHPYSNQDSNVATTTTTTYYGAGPGGFGLGGHSMPQPIIGGNNDKRTASRRKNSNRSADTMGLMTLASSAGSHHQTSMLASTSVPLNADLGSMHAGRVYHATSVLDASSGQLKFAAQPAHQYHHQQQQQLQHRLSGSGLDLAHNNSINCSGSSATYMSVSPSYFGANQSQSLSFSSSSSPPNNQSGSSLIMARVQPMIFNSTASSSKQSIMAFQQATAPSPTSTSSSYSRHRELHKTLEKNRRAHLRHCFELLKAELPSSECVDRKTSHINIIRSAIRCVLTLIEQGTSLELELKRQLEIKNKLTQQLSNLKGNNNNDLTLTLSSTLTSLSQQQQQQQQPVAEQQLSFLLSRSKID